MDSASCIFCEIIAGRAQASVVHDDADTLAFMDLRQFSPGHTLVVPKRHIEDIFGLDAATGAAMMASIARVALAVRAAFEPDGINITASNGEAAGQEVFHLHFHVLPRRSGDGMLRVYPSTSGAAKRDELDAQARAIRARIEAGP